MAEWISVKDRLPKKDGRYIVHTENITGFKPLENNVFIAEFIFNDFVFKGWESNNVTHWQPIPKPPRIPKERGGEK